MTTSSQPPHGGHYFNKHRSANPIHRAILSRYRELVRRVLDPRGEDCILDVGAGEGDLDHWLGSESDASYIGCDYDYLTCAEFARIAGGNERIMTAAADGFALPFPDGCFAKVTCWQVLEHIPDFDRFIDSMRRVCHGRLYLSVPREPMWRVLNMCQGRYLGQWGNTPGHLNHWGAQSFGRLLGRHLSDVELFLSAPPFIVASGRCR